MLYDFLDPINIVTILSITIYFLFLGIFLSVGGICMSLYLKFNPLKPINEENNNIPECLMERGSTASPIHGASTVHPIVKL